MSIISHLCGVILTEWINTEIQGKILIENKKKQGSLDQKVKEKINNETNAENKSVI